MTKYRLYRVNNQVKSKVKGLWIDKGKLYLDNIHIVKYRSRAELSRGVESLFDKGELSAFYTEKSRAIIQDNQGNKTILKHRQLLKRSRLSGQEVKALVKRYGGITIYKRSRGYYIEVWQ